MKIEFTEEEIRERKPETVQKLAYLIRLLMEQSKKKDEKLSTSNEVKICVTENLSMGEKIGG